MRAFPIIHDLSTVITGLVPVIPINMARYSIDRDGRVKPGHDELVE